MQLPLKYWIGALALAAPAWGMPRGREYEIERRDAPTCGVTFYVGKWTGSSSDPTQCSIVTYYNTQSGQPNNNTVLMNNTDCTNYNTAATYINANSGNFDKSSIGPFTLGLSGTTCSDEGENCNPLLTVNGTTSEMNHDSACQGGHLPPLGGGYFWSCPMPCYTAPAGPSCGAPDKGPMVHENGTAQRVSDISSCSSATSCSISAAKASAVANSLTNTKDVTTTNTEGVTTTVTAGAEFLGEGGSVAVAVSQQYSKAISESAGVTQSTTLTTTTTYTYTQAPNTTGYLSWVPLLNCQNITMTCDKGLFHLKSCSQATLSDGTTPDGTYILVPTTA